MKEKRILNVLGQVDEEYIEEAAPVSRRTKRQANKSGWVKWAALAACLCLVVIGAMGAINGVRHRIPQEERPHPAISQGFQLKDAVDRVEYSPLTVGDAAHFRLLVDDTSVYRPMAQDLGAFMGTVGSSDDASLIGCSVYHLARYPASNAICILEKDGQYSIYVAEEEPAKLAYDELLALMEIVPLDDPRFPNYPETYGGAYFEGEKLHLCLTDVSEETTNAYAAMVRDPDVLEYELVAHPYNDLYNATMLIARNSGASFSSIAVDVRGNAVVVGLPFSPNDEAFAAAQQQINDALAGSGDIPVIYTEEGQASPD